jgi:lysophospholipase L1-like esterase
MKITTLLLALGLCATAEAQTLPIKGTIVKPSDKHIQYVGRVNFDNPDRPKFNFPGTEIIASFQGTSLKMIAAPQTGYFMAKIDNAEPFKVSFNAPKDSVVSLATALPDGVHTVRLMYVIEGLFRKPDFRGFVLDEGRQLIDAPALPERKIEFIGNSITCAYGVESLRKEDPFEDETENHYYSFATLVSQALNAQHTSISRSGIGAYRNYNGPKAGSKDNMSWQYEYTLFNDHSQKWDFSKYQPQLVCINLGTNDLSTPNFDIKLYEKGYRKLLKTVRSHYPNAKIVLLSGCMLDDNESALQQKVLNTICEDCNKAGDKNIFRFDFSHQTGSLGYGACWHPSYWQHEKMAGELTPFLREIMNWF